MSWHYKCTLLLVGRKLKALLLLILLSTFVGRAAETDTTYSHLFKEYTKLFYKDDEASVKRFNTVIKQLEDYHLKHNDLYAYFSVRLGEVFYDSDHQRPYDAIKKANALFTEMKSRGEERYFLVYEALGHIFQSRGCYRMAEKYYLDANKNSTNANDMVKMRIFFRLANIHMINNPELARSWNRNCESLSQKYPEFRQTYYVVESIIDFSLNDSDAFWDIYQQHLDLRKAHPELDETGKYTMEFVYHAFKGNFQAAMEHLSKQNSEINEIERLDLKRILFERMNNYQEALKTEIKRGELVDSLNTNLLFDNLNQINAEINLAKVEMKVAKERQLWLIVALVLLSLALGALMWRNITRRKMREQLIKKNKELEIALSHAQESDRMKTSFMRHVSHEIRTPLNIITGFAQIITNPKYELEEKERKKMLNDILENTAEITNIVNELLDVSNEESKEYYAKNDVIDVNQLCQKLMDETQSLNKNDLKLSYVNLLAKDFTMHSNRNAVEKILNHLLNNAIKFTEKGSIELHVRELPANGGIEFCVSDTGIGIAKEHQDKIFDIFYKIDNFKKGFGLGLAACRKTTSLLGGTLKLDDKYTKGARFVLTLPTT